MLCGLFYILYVREFSEDSLRDFPQIKFYFNVSRIPAGKMYKILDWGKVKCYSTVIDTPEDTSGVSVLSAASSAMPSSFSLGLLPVYR